MLKIAYTHASVVLVIFHYHMLQNKQFNRHSLYSMTSVVVLFAYPIKSNISTRKRVTYYKFYQRSCIIILTHLSNAIKKMLDKTSLHKHFKDDLFMFIVHSRKGNIVKGELGDTWGGNFILN